MPAYFVRIVTTHERCLYVEECGPLVEHDIHYVAVPPPIPVAAGFEDTFAFFNGQLNSDDLPIFVILRSNNDDIKIGVVTAVPKVVAKSYVQEIIRPGQATELINWVKGDIQLKVKLLVPYVIGGAVRSYFLAVKTTTQTISLTTVILMPNYNSPGITRFNYLDVSTTRTKMTRNSKSEHRDVYMFKQNVWEMINARLA